MKMSELFGKNESINSDTTILSEIDYRYGKKVEFISTNKGAGIKKLDGTPTAIAGGYIITGEVVNSRGEKTTIENGVIVPPKEPADPMKMAALKFARNAAQEIGSVGQRIGLDGRQLSRQ